MKLKYYLRGFGIGIIFTAVILAVMQVSAPSEMSDKEVIERAKELGMADPEEELLFSTIEPTEQSSPKPTKEEVKNIVVTISPKIKETPKVTQKAKQTKKPKNTIQPQKTEVPVKQGETVTIEVKSGMWSEKICQKLVELGVVDDAQAFDNYLCEYGYESNIKPGIYKVKKGASYEEIAEALTK